MKVLQTPEVLTANEKTMEILAKNTGGERPKSNGQNDLFGDPVAQHEEIVSAAEVSRRRLVDK